MIAIFVIRYVFHLTLMFPFLADVTSHCSVSQISKKLICIKKQLIPFFLITIELFEDTFIDAWSKLIFVLIVTG